MKSRNLKYTIENLKLKVLKSDFVFVTVDLDFKNYRELKPLGMFLEKEGISLIITEETAKRYSLEYETVLNCIVLDIATSLEMVGLSFYISSKLFDAGISANIVSANYHDYIFVPKRDIKGALEALNPS